MILKVTHIIKETPEAVTVCFKNGNFFRKIKYLPGQFIMLDFKIGKDTVKRAYSFSSSPDTDKDLKITVKKVKSGYVSNYINNVLKVGDKVKVDIAMGTFNITPNKENSTQYILFGAGSGITPVYSILKSVIAKEPKSKILLIYANHDKENIIFYNELKKLEQENANQLYVEHILSENLDPKHHTGFLTQEILEIIFNKYNLTFSNHKYMMCGPTGFMDNTVQILKNKGVERKQIMLEAFKAPTIKIDRKNLVSNVTIHYNKETYQLEVPGNKTILQQAMSKNIPLPYSCRSGMCSTCKGNCIDGETIMSKGHLLSDEQVNDGEVLTCITYPNSENVTIKIA
ncbi:ring-1,2-phenylacetyl-CoA epoxidase subunit PaaE [Wenyingzhuangia heitensis]|uniref:Ring-1,2-phenylacetyl-CoA epoxidase subunit PaaE n=1 Tax=Wenyingzhuangia heitensis TaxID=1487859 RepID=A0ABX0U6A6_9FLAO|nr:ferredoxin--NADP reductase [Wenyingzhuangia heitensis]NIJ44385.1 ring-1,2-phenylacetyl-CoA epoxidase subunit PaaE [Wenyingzhuangia heitensis]